MNTNLDKYLNEIIVICFYGRSGSIFLHSLLDNHPNLVSYPGSYLMCYQNWWDNLKSKKSFDCAYNFIDTFRVIFDPKNSDIDLPGCGRYVGTYLNFHKVGENKKEEVSISKDKLKLNLFKFLNKEDEETAISFFKKIHLALALTMDIEINTELKIVFQLHSPLKERCTFLDNKKTKCYFLHMIREPIQSAYSMVKHHMSSGKNIGITGIINTLDRYSVIYRNDLSKAVKLEDLHLNPSETIKKIITFVKIKWSDNLLESTFLGKKWYNVSDSPKISGFNSVIINKTHEEILGIYDKSRLQHLYRKLYKHWDYKIEKKHYFFEYFLRFNIENKINIYNYFVNRMIIFRLLLKNFLNIKTKKIIDLI